MSKLKDLTGKVFGEWTVIERAQNRGGNIYWICLCSCGKTKEVSKVRLLNGMSKSCGSCDFDHIVINTPHIAINIGDKFGSWTVLGYCEIDRNINRNKRYLCVCDCGQTKKEVLYKSLITLEDPQCDKCRQKVAESRHATILKQVWNHFRPSVCWEDESCVNPNTNKILATDLVDHELKISVEVQSGYHDMDCQKERDKIKKIYWESIGYNHYQVDIRNYSILEMVQLFFPFINKIPEWVDLSGKVTSRKWSLEDAQILLNKGMVCREIAINVGTTKSAINSAISEGKLIRIYPVKHAKIKTNKTKRNKILAVQISLEGEYICTWENATSIYKELNINASSISACCKGTRKTAGGFRWMYKENYEQLNNNNQEAI